MTLAFQLMDEPNLTAAHLTAEDIKLATSLLYQTYKDDPFFMATCQADKLDYQQRVRAMIREELIWFWQNNHSIVGLYHEEVLIGVACIIHVTDKNEPRRFWHWRLKMMLSAGIFGTQQLLSKESTILSEVPYDNFHLLSFIAIHPAYQKKGYGRYLTSALDSLLTAETASRGIVVFASQAKYRGYFEACNYQFLTEISIGTVQGSLLIHQG